MFERRHRHGESLKGERRSPAGDFSRSWPAVRTSVRLPTNVAYRRLDPELVREASCALEYGFRQEEDKGIHLVGVRAPQLHKREARRGVIYSGDNCVWIIEAGLTERAENRKKGDVLARLEEAVKARSEALFLNALKDVRWEDQTAKGYIRAIQLAIEAGAHLAARKISADGARQFPESTELQKYAHVLAPPNVFSTDSAPNPRQGANLDWLKANADEYRGKWVAVKDGQLLDSANTYRELISKVGETRGTGILVTKAF